eukprot:9478069-Pyramimonas_sp.AAC.1
MVHLFSTFSNTGLFTSYQSCFPLIRTSENPLWVIRRPQWFGGALAYFDGMRRGRCSANMIQAQRDFFGAHTFKRLDKEGSFHAHWRGAAFSARTPSSTSTRRAPSTRTGQGAGWRRGGGKRKYAGYY